VQWLCNEASRASVNKGGQVTCTKSGYICILVVVINTGLHDLAAMSVCHAARNAQLETHSVLARAPSIKNISGDTDFGLDCKKTQENSTVLCRKT
jgi:hypothetical protein